MARSLRFRIDAAIDRLTKAKNALAVHDYETTVLQLSSATGGIMAVLNKLEDEHGLDADALHQARRDAKKIVE